MASDSGVPLTNGVVLNRRGVKLDSDAPSNRCELARIPTALDASGTGEAANDTVLSTSDASKLQTLLSLAQGSTSSKDMSTVINESVQRADFQTNANDLHSDPPNSHKEPKQFPKVGLHVPAACRNPRPSLFMLPPEVSCLIYHQLLEQWYGKAPVETFTYRLPPDTTDIRVRSRVLTISLKMVFRLLPGFMYTNFKIHQECLHEISRMYMLRFELPQAMWCGVFVYRFKVHLASLPIELDIFRSIAENKQRKWSVTPYSHCTHNRIKLGSDFRLIEFMPSHAKLYLVITAIWRDFETLRYLAVDSKVKDKVKGIRFELTTPPESEPGIWPLPDEEFLKRQTIAAIMGFEDYLCDNTQAERLIMHGCRGFDWRAPANTKA